MRLLRLSHAGFRVPGASAVLPERLRQRKIPPESGACVFDIIGNFWLRE